MNQRDKWLEMNGLSETHKGLRLTYTQQPPNVRTALAMIDQGSPRFVACYLCDVEPDSWDLEIKVVEYHVEHRVAVRLFSRFENGGDNRAVDQWREHAGRFKGDARSNYDKRELRDLFADNPVMLEFLAWQEEQLVRGNPLRGGPESEGIPVDSLQTETGDES